MTLSEGFSWNTDLRKPSLNMEFGSTGAAGALGALSFLTGWGLGSFAGLGALGALDALAGFALPPFGWPLVESPLFFDRSGSVTGSELTSPMVSSGRVKHLIFEVVF